MLQRGGPTTRHQDIGEFSDDIKQSPQGRSIARVSIFGSHGEPAGDFTPPDDYRVNELRGCLAEKVIEHQSRLQDSGIGTLLAIKHHANVLNYYTDTSGENLGVDFENHDSLIPLDGVLRQQLFKLWALVEDPSSHVATTVGLRMLIAVLYKCVFGPQLSPRLATVLAEVDWRIETELHSRVTLEDFVVLLFEFTRLWLMGGDDTNGELLVHQLKMLFSTLVDLDHDLQVKCFKSLPQVRSSISPLRVAQNSPESVIHIPTKLLRASKRGMLTASPRSADFSGQRQRAPAASEARGESGLTSPPKPLHIRSPKWAPQYFLSPPSPTASENTAAGTVGEWARNGSPEAWDEFDMTLTAIKMNLHVQHNGSSDTTNAQADQEGIQPTHITRPKTSSRWPDHPPARMWTSSGLAPRRARAAQAPRDPAPTFNTFKADSIKAKRSAMAPEPRARMPLRRTNLPFREQFRLAPNHRRGRHRRASSEPSTSEGAALPVLPTVEQAEASETVTIQMSTHVEPTLAHIAIGAVPQVIIRLGSQQRSPTVISLLAEEGGGAEGATFPAWGKSGQRDSDNDSSHVSKADDVSSVYTRKSELQPSSPPSRRAPDCGLNAPSSPPPSSIGGSSVAESQSEPGAVVGTSLRSLSSRKLNNAGEAGAERAATARSSTRGEPELDIAPISTRQGRRIEDGSPCYDDDGMRLLSPQQLDALLSRLNTPCRLSANGCRPRTATETVHKLRRVRSRTKEMLSFLSTAQLAPLETLSEVNKISRGKCMKPPRWMYARSLGSHSLLPSDCRPSTLFL